MATANATRTRPTVVEFDDSDPLVQADREPAQLADTIALFAQAVGLVERMARAGDVELVTELARIAYARGRRGERAANAA